MAGSGRIKTGRVAVGEGRPALGSWQRRLDYHGSSVGGRLQGLRAQVAVTHRHLGGGVSKHLLNFVQGAAGSDEEGGVLMAKVVQAKMR